MSQDPAAVYQDRLVAHRSAHACLERLDARLAYARLGVFALAIAMGLTVWLAALTPWLLLAPAAAFLALMVRHDRVLRARDAAARAIAHYERGQARIEDRWAGTGEPGSRFLDADHPYAADLDLFGPASLFELLSTARTRDGEEMLAGWLLAGAPQDVIRARQQAIAELGTSIDIRERMAVIGGAVIGIDTTGLRAWARQPPPQGLGVIRLTTYLFAIAAAIATAFLAIEGTLLPLGLVLVFQAAARMAGGSRLDALLDIATGKARELATLSDMFKEQQSAAVASDRLVVLRDRLAEPVPAPRAIRALQRLAERRDWEHSLPLIPAGLFAYGFISPEAAFAIDLAFVATSGLLLFSPLLALAVERWRQAHCLHVDTWIAALAECEALLALGTYHFEHPQDPFPTIEAGEAEMAAVFDGAALGHPLLPAQRMVRNDVRLATGTQLLVVSGSNMSGKSTLLRTVGINAVLALAGAPVRAASLRLTPLRIGATLRIQDSLRDGRSRFFAEITRIRALADMAAGPVPLLFLIDELLHGTNSHDRLVGAAGILRALLARGAIGLITTHDLALTAIGDELAPRARNVHFEDFFDAGEIRFDYRIKQGPVTRSNALALMRAVGLDVAPEV